MKSDRPTEPPSSLDADAQAFAARLAILERTRRRTESGLMRALAEATFGPLKVKEPNT
jgi:hypothetical protein